MIMLSIVLSNTGGTLDRAELAFDRADQVQHGIQTVIADWQLRPGDTIKILGNEEAHDKL